MSALPRTPSLRELEARPSANVAVLPTAARRRVKQRWNAEAMAAGKALRDQHAERFPYRAPHARAVEPMAKAMIEAGRSTELLLLVGIMQQLPRTDREAIAERLGRSDTDEGRRAHLIAQTTLIDYGTAAVLQRAMARMMGEG